ncbi:MAG TPA: peptide chain release factor 1 [Acidobacteriota bacterium]|jgi:peptide chain release factor 1|nr:peptide chain release factor 1 [Acidobacteriota bacterium]
MFERLEEIQRRYEDLSHQLGDPTVISDPEKYQKLAKTHGELQEIVDKYRQYKNIDQGIRETREMIVHDSDSELLALAKEEMTSLENQREKCVEELKELLVPRDPNDSKNVILEIRAGTGGDEATLFASEMFRMYTRYAEREGWKVELLSAHYSGVGGVKEVIAMVEGNRVYSKLKYESGVHRVQRVPQTEASGRVHTSAVTVAVLPEADEVEVQINPKDLRIDTFCSSGPGGQSVNTTYSAVRITHLPTGEVVSCQDEKSQIKNRAKAMRVLRSRLYERALAEQQSQIAQNRRTQVGTGDRSEKVRTYNFPQNRLTDHRIGLTLHRLDSIMDGDLDEVIDSLVAHFQAEKLKKETETAA